MAQWFRTTISSELRAGAQSCFAVYTAQWVYTVEFYWYCSKIALLWASLFAPPSRSQCRRWPDRSIYLSESRNPWEASSPKNELKKRSGDGRVSVMTWSLIFQKSYFLYATKMYQLFLNKPRSHQTYCFYKMPNKMQRACHINIGLTNCNPPPWKKQKTLCMYQAIKIKNTIKSAQQLLLLCSCAPSKLFNGQFG